MSLRPHGTTRLPQSDFHEIFEKIQVSSKSDKNNGYFACRPMQTFLIISRSVLLRMRNVSGKSSRENENTFFFQFFFFFENRAVYLLMWKNNEEAYRAQMTIWRMRIACRVNKVTQTLTINTNTNTIDARTRLNATFTPTICAMFTLTSSTHP